MQTPSNQTPEQSDVPEDDDVGYGRPPKSSQFKPGHSGNKKGRPKGRKSLEAMIERELNSKVMISDAKGQSPSKKRL